MGWIADDRSGAARAAVLKGHLLFVDPVGVVPGNRELLRRLRNGDFEGIASFGQSKGETITRIEHPGVAAGSGKEDQRSQSDDPAITFGGSTEDVLDLRQDAHVLSSNPACLRAIGPRYRPPLLAAGASTTMSPSGWHSPLLLKRLSKCVPEG